MATFKKLLMPIVGRMMFLHGKYLVQSEKVRP